MGEDSKPTKGGAKEDEEIMTIRERELKGEA